MKMAKKPVKVGVIGAGIIGMSCAYRLQTELSGVKVTVVAEDFSPNLTSDGAAGIWELYDYFNTDPETIKGWAMKTYEYLKGVALSPSSINAGVSLLKLLDLTEERRDQLPWYAHHVHHFRRLSPHEIDKIDKNCVDGFSYTSMTCEPRIYLPWIMAKFRDAGGIVEKGTVSSLSQFCERFDLVINCTGLKASQLVDDTSMYPIRGQLVKVRGVNILNGVVDGPYYIIPGRDMVTLGGTFDDRKYSTEIDPNVKADIMEGCCKMDPRLKKCTIVMDWCGLRPARKEGVRLEVDGSYHPTTKVIHNYGHAGVGITLHWGCAGHVLHLARRCLSLPSAKL